MADGLTTSTGSLKDSPTPGAIRRHRGSFMIMALIAFIGLFALSAPAAISKTVQKCAEDKLDKDHVYDLKLSYDLGFTDNDISPLLASDSVEAVSPAPDITATVTQNSAIDTLTVYPSLYLKVSGTDAAPALSTEYTGLVDNAKKDIETNIEPSLSAARIQSFTSEINRKISALESSISESETKSSELDQELSTIDEDYEKLMDDMREEQESINEAKDLIQSREKSAQTTIENGKKNLTGVLNEVYGKSQVTASDLSRAQGLSNYVSSTEKSLHSSFTSEWSEISALETRMHEEQVELSEQTEQKKQEIATEKAQLSQNKIDTAAQIESLKARLNTKGGRWIIEDRSSIPSYGKILSAYTTLNTRFIPLGLLIYIISLISCIAIAVSIVTRNKARIASWRKSGLDDRIISPVFTRRTGLAVAIGALIGVIVGGLISPVAYMYSYEKIFELSVTRLGFPILPALAGTAAIILASALASFLTYELKIGVKNPGKPKSDPKPEKDGNTLKIDQLQEKFLKKYAIPENRDPQEDDIDTI
ncbi:MAG: hypothetical protein K6G42_05970 [Lachnospiraceae bacterium]|nr:hypothetical protein [Lachnospiraceae bacterium]